MALSVIIGVIAAVIPLVWIAYRWLQIDRDFLFLVLYFEAVVYAHGAPTLAIQELPAQLVAPYLWIQLGVLLLFEIPLVALYAAGMSRFNLPARSSRAPRRPVSLSVSAFGYLSFSILALTLCSAFAWVGVVHGLFFRRVGHEALALSTVSLPYFQWAFYRLYGEAGLLINAVLLLCYLRTTGGTLRKFGMVVLGINLVVYGAYVLANNRLQSIVALLVLYAVFKASQPMGRAPLRARSLILLAVTAFYLARVVVNVREAIVTGSLGPRVLNPFLASDSEDTPLRWRVNCIDLLAHMSPRAEEKGFAMGRAWLEPAVIFVRSIYDPSSVQESKLAARTNAKSYLLDEYTDFNTPDYFSCALTDAYGNFGGGGLFFAALVFAGLLVAGVSWLHDPPSATKLLFGLMFIVQALQFDNELISIPLNWIKFLPIMVIVAVSRPIVVSYSEIRGTKGVRYSSRA